MEYKKRRQLRFVGTWNDITVDVYSQQFDRENETLCRKCPNLVNGKCFIIQHGNLK